MLQAAQLSLITQLSDKNITEFLKTEHQKIKNLSREHGFDASRIISNIPLSKATLMQKLGLDINLSEQICCSECFKLYPIPEIPKDENKPLPVIPTTCTTTFYSEAKKFLKQIGNRVTLCDTKLVNIKGTGHKMKIKPIKKFSY